MDMGVSCYINRNTGNLTTNIKNTYVADEENVAMKKKYCAFGISEVESAEERINANCAELPYQGDTVFNRLTNSIDYGKGATIGLRNGYSIELNSSGWKVNYGDPDDLEADQYAQTMATNMTNLLKYAEQQFKNPTATNAELKDWSTSVIDGLKRSGIDTSRPFTVNGMEFIVEDGEVKSTAKLKADSEALDAYNVLQAQNKTFDSCDEDTRKNIDLFFNYYCSNVPDEVKNAWYESMEETNTNPFANNSYMTPKLSLQKDYETGGNPDIYGDTIESAENAVDSIIAYINNRDTNLQEQNFYLTLKNKLSEL